MAETWRSRLSEVQLFAKKGLIAVAEVGSPAEEQLNGHCAGARGAEDLKDEGDTWRVHYRTRMVRMKRWRMP